MEEARGLVQVLGKLIGSHGDPAHFDGTEVRPDGTTARGFEVADAPAGAEATYSPI